MNTRAKTNGQQIETEKSGPPPRQLHDDDYDYDGGLNILFSLNRKTLFKHLIKTVI